MRSIKLGLLLAVFVAVSQAQFGNNAKRIQGVLVCADTPTNTQVFAYNSSRGCWTPSSAGGSGSVTSVGLAGTANQITVTGATPITGSGSWTLTLPSILTLPGTLNKITFTPPTTAWTIQPSADNQTTIVPTGTLVNTGVTTLSSLANLGTIATGTWQSTKIGLAYGGTNADLSATGGTSQVLKQTSVGGAVTVARLACADLSDSAPGCSATYPILTAPISGNWTAFNTGSMVQAPTFGSGRFTWAGINASGGDHVQGVATAIPSAPYTATFRIWPLLGGNNTTPTNFPAVQVGWADGTVGTPGKLVTAGPVWVPGGVTLGGANCNSTTSVNGNLTLATILQKGPYISSGGPVWLRLTDNSTNWLVDYSYDGYNWVNIVTETRNTFATATQLVVQTNPSNSSVSQAVVFDSYATGVP